MQQGEEEVVIFKLWNLQDFTQTPPAQELVARDLHDQDWHFRHIYRGKSTIFFVYLDESGLSYLV